MALVDISSTSPDATADAEVDDTNTGRELYVGFTAWPSRVSRRVRPRQKVAEVNASVQIAVLEELRAARPDRDRQVKYDSTPAAGSYIRLGQVS